MHIKKHVCNSCFQACQNNFLRVYHGIDIENVFLNPLQISSHWFQLGTTNLEQFHVWEFSSPLVEWQTQFMLGKPFPIPRCLQFGDRWFNSSHPTHTIKGKSKKEGPAHSQYPPSTSTQRRTVPSEPIVCRLPSASKPLLSISQLQSSHCFPAHYLIVLLNWVTYQLYPLVLLLAIEVIWVFIYLDNLNCTLLTLSPF